MLNPVYLTNSSLNYLGKNPQQLRPEDQTVTVGREQTLAPESDPDSLNRMLPVTGKPETEGNVRTDKDAQGPKECETCKRRRYQDGSDDPGVSFKTPGKIDPDVAASVVMGHEQEHVSREQAKAEREGREVVYQAVVLHTAVCPECGRVYVSGGTTRTVTKAAEEIKQPETVPEKEEEGKSSFSAFA